MTFQAAVEAFVTREARLLDAQDWDAWDALFTADGVYWMPAAWGQPDALGHVSLIHDDALLRQIRIARFRDPQAPALHPRPRGLRLVANVIIEGEADGDVLASARMVASEHRRGETLTFHAGVRWRLEHGPQDFRIRLKRVDLLDCDMPRGDINLYL